MNNDEEYILIWEAPKIEKPEFRLYYDDKGKVVTYTCEKLEGNYLLIDAQTYAEGRPDVRVLDGKIIRISANAVVSKLVPNKEGQNTTPSIFAVAKVSPMLDFMIQCFFYVRRYVCTNRYFNRLLALTH